MSYSARPQDSATARPLSGVRIVCLANYVPAPAAARRLAALGAEVLRVQPPTGDPLASWSPGWYDALRSGQTIRRLDLKAAADRAAFDSLLEDADLLLTALRPAALARLGLDWPRLQARHPHLCSVAIVGHASPDANRAGHDLTYLASHGLLRPPQMPATLLADLAGAERAASAALALLLARERGRGAGCAEVSLAESAGAFAEPLSHGITAPGGVLGGGFPGYALYEARDGWIALAALEPHFWSRLTGELGLPTAAGREVLGGAFLERTADAWERWAGERGLPIAAVRAPG